MYIYIAIFLLIKNIRFGIRMLIIDSLYNTMYVDEREKERKGVVCTWRVYVLFVRACVCVRARRERERECVW